MDNASMKNLAALEARLAAVEAQLAAILASPPPPPPAVNKDDEIKRLLLFELACARAAGIDAVPRKWLAVLMRRSPRSSDLHGFLADLGRQGYVVFPGKSLASLTEKPLPFNEPPVPLTFETLIRRLHQGVLEPADANILKHLAFQWPKGDWTTRTELAAAVGQSPESSSFQSRVAMLAKLGLTENRAPGLVRATLHWFTAFPAAKKGRAA